MHPLVTADGLPELPQGEALVDSHCHLEMAVFDGDREAVLERASRFGVRTIVTIGAGGGIGCNVQALALAQDHPEVFATVGIHPHEASIVDNDLMIEIACLAEHSKVVAIGETGLDYHYDHSPRPQQQEAFRRFVALARETRLPLVVHLRKSDADGLRILREEHANEIGGVIHCFSGTAASARNFLDLGFHLSFSGVLTFKAADEIRAAARLAPADRILLETDAPFLAPAPHRGRRNEPAWVLYTARCLAEVRGQPLAALAAQTRENTERLFRLEQHRGAPE